MFQKFRQSFSPDTSSGPEVVSIDTGVPSLNDLLSSFSGVSFNRGLYRIVRAQDLPVWSSRILLGFPAFAGRITCFGYDWLGRTFAIDTKRIEEGEPGVVMFEPGTGEALQIPANVRTFHETELHEYQDAALASNFYATWRRNGGAAPAYDQCIGYNVPLFLGGKDDSENLELTDLEVYWHITAQLCQGEGVGPGYAGKRQGRRLKLHEVFRAMIAASRWHNVARRSQITGDSGLVCDCRIAVPVH